MSTQFTAHITRILFPLWYIKLWAFKLQEQSHHFQPLPSIILNSRACSHLQFTLCCVIIENYLTWSHVQRHRSKIRLSLVHTAGRSHTIYHITFWWVFTKVAVTHLYPEILGEPSQRMVNDQMLPVIFMHFCGLVG